MSLRKLLAVVLSSLISVRAIILIIVGTSIILGASLQVIQNQDNQQVLLIRNIFLNNIAHLKEHSILIKNDFVETNKKRNKNILYIKDLERLNLSFYAYSNNQGTKIYHKVFSGKEKPFNSELDRFISKVLNKDILYKKHGIVILNNKPYFVVFTPIRESKRKSGYIILGQEITESLINQESQLLDRKIQFKLYNDPKLSGGFKQAKLHLNKDSQEYLTALNEKITSAYTIFYDLNGQPAILLRADLPRTVYLLLRNAFIAVLMIYLVVGFIYTKVVYYIFDKYLLNRLQNLSSWVKEITEKKNLSARYTDFREDELTEVAHALNNLLDELENTLYKNKLAMMELDSKANELENKTHELEVKNKELTAKNFELETTAIKIAKKDKEIETKNKELKILDNSKYQLMNMTILDLKNPLTAIKCFSEVLCIWVKQNIEKSPDRRKAELTEIANALGDMLYELEKNIYKYDQASREVEIKAKELQLKNEELRILDNKKNELLGIAAHDLRNPLTTIKCFSDILLSGSIGNITPKQEHGIKLINKASNDMFTIINDLLDVSVIEKGKLSLKLERDDLNKLMIYKINSNQIIANQKNIKIHHTLHPISRAIFDKNRIGQVLDNLISNAIKYSEPGSDIYVYMTQDADMAKITVEDHGPGLSDEDKTKLFGTFQKLSARPTAGEKSTGLGLAIVKKIVQAHKGTIHVDSHLGIGSKFIFTVPLAVEDDDDLVSYIKNDEESNLKKAG